MLLAASAVAALAAVLHVGFFLVETVLFDSSYPRFGLTADDLPAARPWAFNQGFYNLFLALVVGTGVVVAWTSSRVVGETLVCAGTACMLGASVVLAASQPRLARSAALQGVPALAALVLAVVTA